MNELKNMIFGGIIGFMIGVLLCLFGFWVATRIIDKIMLMVL